MTGQNLGAPPVVGVDASILALRPNSFWKLDEASGTFADSGSGGISGTYVSGTRAAKGYRGSLCVDTIVSGSDVSTALATFGDNYRFAGNAPFTILTLYRPTAFGTNFRRAIAKESATANTGWILAVTSAGQPALNRRSGSSVTGDQVVTLSEYNLIAGTYDGATVGIYHNSILKTAADATTLLGDTNVIRINGELTDAVNWGTPGRFDCVAIWTRALNQAELDSIWAAL